MLILEGLMPETGQDAAAATLAKVEARLARLDSRVTRAEQRFHESQETVSRRLSEILGLVKKKQEARDARVDETLRRVLAQLTDLRDRLMVDPTVTH
jgi:hypothetical protein